VGNHRISEDAIEVAGGSKLDVPTMAGSIERLDGRPMNCRSMEDRGGALQMMISVSATGLIPAAAGDKVP
jgi:hypothetical protein